MTRFYSVTFVEGNFDRTASVLAFESKKDRAEWDPGSKQQVALINVAAKNALMREGLLMRLAVRTETGAYKFFGTLATAMQTPSTTTTPKMSTEILVYGIPAGETEQYTEVLLACFPKTAAATFNINRVKAAASADGFHSFRVARFENFIKLL